MLEGRPQIINSRRRKPEWINIHIYPRKYVLISDNSQVGKLYFDSNTTQKENVCDIATLTNGLIWGGRRRKLNVFTQRHEGAKRASQALATWFITNFDTAPFPVRS